MQSSVVNNPKEVTMTIIGIDPHPGSHTAAALDKNGKILGHKTVNNDFEGLTSLLKWLKEFKVEQCGIEGANNPFSRDLSSRLLNEGYYIVNVHPSLTSQYRSKRGLNKTDEVDAENIARAVIANPDLNEFKPQEAIEELKQLTRIRAKLAEERTALRLSIKTIKAPQAHQALEAVITTLTTEIKALEAAMKDLVNKLMPELVTLQGIAVIQASTLLSEIGDIRCFRSQHSFAMFAGCAPIERSSGGSKRRQVNRGGNRRLNSVFHMMIQVRLRWDDNTKTYVEKKIKEGKTKRSAFRCLKTHIARQVYRFMLDATIQHPERWVSP